MIKELIKTLMTTWYYCVPLFIIVIGIFAYIVNRLVHGKKDKSNESKEFLDEYDITVKMLQRKYPEKDTNEIKNIVLGYEYSITINDKNESKKILEETHEKINNEVTTEKETQLINTKHLNDLIDDNDSLRRTLLDVQSALHTKTILLSEYINNNNKLEQANKELTNTFNQQVIDNKHSSNTIQQLTKENSELKDNYDKLTKLYDILAKDANNFANENMKLKAEIITLEAKVIGNTIDNIPEEEVKLTIENGNYYKLEQLRNEKKLNIYVWYSDTINCTIEKLDGECITVIRDNQSYEDALNKVIEYVKVNFENSNN